MKASGRGFVETSKLKASGGFLAFDLGFSRVCGDEVAGGPAGVKYSKKFY
jgi:hypothetical protein